MGEKRIILEKSGGKRMSLYAEVGRYFAADGSFDELAFRGVLREALAAIEQRCPQREGFVREANIWLTEYLTQVTEYLEEKGMNAAATAVFRVALDEIACSGIDEVVVAPQQLGRLLACLPQPVKKLKKVRPDEKRRRIFTAAIEVFAESGFHGARMEEIAARSGVAKGTVYMHFPSKEELLNQLLEEQCQVIVQQVNTIFARETHILQQIQAMIEFWIRFIEDNHQLYRLIQSEAIFQRSSSKVMFYDYIISHLPMLKERIVALNREDKLKTTSFYTTFYGIMGFIDGVVNKWYRCGRDYPLTDEIPVIVEVLFNGFVGQEINRSKLP